MFLPCGLATLMTDLGFVDPSVGIMKGVMISRFAQLRIVDLCHHVPPQDVFWASYALAGSYKNFPPGTVHCAVVARGVPRILAAEAGGHVFVAPDNGLLTRVLLNGGTVHRVDLERVPVAVTRRTFHTRDVIAPVGALLASGKLAVEECGEQEPEPRRLEQWATRGTDDSTQGVVVGEDRFGNLLTSLTEEDVPSDAASAVVELAGQTIDIRGSYAEAEAGSVLALFNPFGMLEIAIRDGKASQRFEWERGTPIIVRRA